MWKKFPDSLLIGIVSGCLSLSVFYCLFAFIRILIVSYYQNTYLFKAPKVAKFAIFLNVVFFRFVIVKGEKEEFGKGILLATVGVSFIYFYYFFRFHQPIFGL